MEGNFYPLGPPGIDPGTSRVPRKRAIRCATRSEDFARKKFEYLYQFLVVLIVKFFQEKSLDLMEQRIACSQGTREVHGSNPDQAYEFEFPSMNLFVLPFFKGLYGPYIAHKKFGSWSSNLNFFTK